MEFYYADGDVQKGPVPLEELPRHGLTPGTLVWREGMNQWLRADAVDELRGVLAVAAGAFPEPPPAPAMFAEAPAPAPGGYEQAIPTPYPAQQIVPTPYPEAQPLAYGGYAGPGGRQPPAGMAVASLVLGIASFPLLFAYCAGLVTAILAVIFGHLARGRARRGESGGAGLALAGMICGYVVLGIFAVLLLIGSILALQKK